MLTLPEQMPLRFCARVIDRKDRTNVIARGDTISCDSREARENVDEKMREGKE